MTLITDYYFANAELVTLVPGLRPKRFSKPFAQRKVILSIVCANIVFENDSNKFESSATLSFPDYK